FSQQDCAAGRITVDDEASHAAAMPLAFASTLGNLTGALDRDRAKDRGMYELVDQSQLQRLLCADLFASENEVECTRQPNLPRQPLRTSGARNQPELNFRQTENRLWVIGSDAIPARDRRLKPAAETRTVHRGDPWT